MLRKVKICGVNTSELPVLKKKEKNELEEYLEEIIKDYTNSNITLFNQIAFTLKNWRKEIINSFDEYDGRRINNGPIEGRNKYI